MCVSYARWRRQNVVDARIIREEICCSSKVHIIAFSPKKIMEWDRSKINILFINSIPTNRGRSIGNRYKSREFFSCMICVDIFFSSPHDDFIFYFEFSMRYLQKDRTRLEELSCFRDHVDYNEKIPFERLILFLKKGSKKSFNSWKIRNFFHKKMFKIHFFV